MNLKRKSIQSWVNFISKETVLEFQTVFSYFEFEMFGDLIQNLNLKTNFLPSRAITRQCTNQFQIDKSKLVSESSDPRGGAKCYQKNYLAQNSSFTLFFF